MADLFTLTEDHRTFQDVVRKLVADRVAPRAAEIDATCEFPWDVKEVFAEAGLLGLHIPERYGGAGADLVTFAVLTEEVAKACASSSLIPMVQKLGSVPLLMGASEEQKQAWFPKLATGEELICYAISEPEAGSDPASMRTVARREGDEWVINGGKVWISNAAVSDCVTLLAKTDPDAGARGVSAFYVRTDDPGFSVGKSESKLGIKGSPTSQLIFENCRIPADRLIGEEGKGFTYAMQAFDHTRPTIGAQAVGIAQGAIDYCIGYLRERHQFGKPIGSFQGLQFMLADMAIETEAARQLVYTACAKVDRGEEDMTLFSSIAKCKAGDVAMAVTTDAVQMLGGYGYTTEYPVERMMRDAKITQIYEGTQQIQRVVVSRQLLGKL